MLKEYTKQRGMIISKVTEYIPDTKMNKTAIKQEKKDSLVISVNGVKLDANADAINNMSSVVALANYKFNALVANGTSSDDAFDSIYNTTVNWKGADNKVHSLKISTLCKALETALGEIANIVGV